MKKLSKCFFKLFMKLNAISLCKPSNELKKNDLTSKENLLKKRNISVGSVAWQSLSKLKRKDIITHQQVDQLEKSSVCFRAKLLRKVFFEKSPLNSFFIRNTRIFDQYVLLKLSNEEYELCLKVILTNLVYGKIIYPNLLTRLRLNSRSF